MTDRRVTIEIEPPAAMLYKEAQPLPARHGMNRVERVNLACLAAIALVLTLLLGSYIQPASAATGLVPCATEDAATVACYWDAKHRGNGQGQSFIWTGISTIYTR